MKKSLIIGLFCVLCVLMVNSSMALADGKFYVSEKVPPDLPYQRALISYHDGQELLILQSKFEGPGKDFGWVIPVPNQPKLGSMKSDETRHLFRHLDFHTRSKVTDGKALILSIILLIIMVMLIVIVVGQVSCAIRRKPVPKLFTKLFSDSLSPVILLLLILVISAIAIPGHLGSRLGIEVLSRQQVGVYDITVIKASSAQDLIEWLNKHNYQFTSADKAVFEDYVQQGWCFVTARINAEELPKKEFRSSEGVVNPLVLVFESKQMVYPLALTATVGTETEVLLYTLAISKMKADERFELEAAVENRLNLVELKIESSDDLNLKRFNGRYLTKFKARLSPDQMKQDLILTPAPDNKSYRKHIWRW